MVLVSRPFGDHEVDVILRATGRTGTYLKVFRALRREEDTVLPASDFSFFDRDWKGELGTYHRFIARPVVKKNPILRLLWLPLQVENKVDIQSALPWYPSV